MYIIFCCTLTRRKPLSIASFNCCILLDSSISGYPRTVHAVQRFQSCFLKQWPTQMGDFFLARVKRVLRTETPSCLDLWVFTHHICLYIFNHNLFIWQHLVSWVTRKFKLHWRKTNIKKNVCINLLLYASVYHNCIWSSSLKYHCKYLLIHNGAPAPIDNKFYICL